MRRLRPQLPAWIFVAALALRAGWVLWRWKHTGAALEFSDEDLHWQLARHLVADGALVSDDGRYAARMPLYPLFLALFATWRETGVLAARLAQALLGAATAWMACRLAGRAFGRRGALVAGALVAIDPFGIFFCNLLLTEVLFTAIAVALIGCGWLVLADSEADERFSAVGVAVLGAAAVLVRPSSAGWIVALWAALWLLDRNRRRGTRRIVLNAVVMAAALLPWGLRNRALIGAPAWLSTNGGVTLFDALGPQADGSSNQAFLHYMPHLEQLNEVQADRVLRRLAVAEIRKNPRRVLRLAWVKFLRTWSLTPHVAEYRGGPAAWAGAVYTLAVVLAALVGLWRATRTRGASSTSRAAALRLHALVWLPVVYFTLVHCVFIGSLRYRVPLMPLLALAAATAVTQRDRIAPGPPAPECGAGGER